jgi:Uroporphyrinogen-III synthase
LQVDFLPSTANGKALAAELPADSAAGTSVLFPSSALAADDIAEGLAARGIRTQRINTYTTAPAAWSAADLARAQSARLVTFGSPSAVRVWTERVGTAAAAVCIGETTAAQARDSGFGTVIAPSRPEGSRATMFEAWAACCAEAVADDGPLGTGR